MKPLLQIHLLLCFCLMGVFLAGGNPSRPNFVVILVDDMGYSDLGSYGGEIETPYLDQLAEDGLRYSQFYNTGRCWPTRSSLLTGYYAPAIGMDPPIKMNGLDAPQPEWVRPLPVLLQEAGYQSYHSGKWHYRNFPQPVAHGGFARSYFVRSQDNKFWGYPHLLDDEPLPDFEPADATYNATAISDHAVGFLEAHAQTHPDDPFFLYLAYPQPHFPLKAPPEDIAKYEGVYTKGWEAIARARWERLVESGLVSNEIAPVEYEVNQTYPHLMPDEETLRILGPGETLFPQPWADLSVEQKAFQARKMAIHAAMVDRMDQEVGRVIAQLKSMQVFDDTVIFLLSDNGASAEIMIRGMGHDAGALPGSEESYLCLGPGWAHASNTPFRRYKSWVHEGGVSTPLIVHWPNGIQDHGAIRSTPGHVVDLVPTLLTLAGMDPLATSPGSERPALQGFSLVPSFYSDRAAGRDFIFFHHQGNRALRMGDWKIVSAQIDEQEWFLYNLATDRGEQIDRKNDEPGLFTTMVNRWTQLDAAYRSLPSFVPRSQSTP